MARMMSRRQLLQFGGTAAAAAAVTPFLRPSFAFAADTYDAMRTTWVGLLTGSGFDATAAPFSTALATLGSQAGSDQSSMAPATGSLWPDLPIGSVSANVTSSYSRLKTMALAYVQPGTGLTGSASLASAVTTGLDWLYSHAYTPTTTSYDNWWDWQIGAPQALLDTALLLYPSLSSTQLANYCAAVDHSVPASTVATYSGTSTGANRVDLCRVLMLRGVLGKSSAPLTTAQTALSPVFPYVLSGDGFYADGSFVQHTYIPYTGTYGDVLLGDISKLLTLTAGTTWAITDPDVQNIFTAVTASYARFLYNGLIMDGVCGRAVSRGVQLSDPLRIQQDDNTRGHGVVSDILRLAESGAAPAAQSAAWKSMVKGWLQRQYYEPILKDAGVQIPELARAQALLNDSTVTATAEPVNSVVLGMDRAVHRRAGWAAQLSICSSRTTFYETGNGENLKGWHQNSGMLYWYGDTYGDGQYADAFWPTVDPYLLPGTTVSTLALADAAGGAWGASHPDTAWAGGVTDGTYSVVGQDVRGLQSTLTGRKSWFLLDDSIYCLGAGITCADGTDVRTTVDNRNLGTGNSQVFTVDGATQPTTLGWTQTFTDPGSMAIGGMGAWVFPEGGTVHVQRTARSGAWSDVNTGSSTAPLTRNYLSLWFDHGTDPSGAGYCYQLMPGATAAQAAARAASPNVSVLANTSTAQAISCSSLGLTMADFFAAGSAGPITVDGPCSVLMREQGGSMTVVVSDPTRASTTVKVTIARSTYASATSTSGVTVLSTSGQVVLLAETGGTHGAGRTATLSSSGTAPANATAARLGAVATAYVRDGSYAATNYGDATTMVVKNANASDNGYNRRSLLKFDVSGVSGAVSRAVLWVYGNVQDSGGTTTTLQAFGTSSDTWTESTVTWDSAPAVTTALGTGMISTGADWVALDVTAAVAAAQTGAGGDGTASLAVFEPLGAAGLATVLNTRLSTANPPRLEVVGS
ncbi:polysaccharide lyase family 8 super-sandwich domain-containing protein [Streptacidiphilus anmyonensis]|uniref:polysaccharide lyase family 8 super-sandwich domain-containing protein n=1 Tax=Streptacidiphilus anmyonensis TaxID=405782 RepID=UPI000AF929CB|nr:polysaccharide lyase family 8 super-sandwich domain-containing protein [Streptacidiphilus anmyonensis]